MIFILINFLFNGFVLGLIFAIGCGFMPSEYIANINHSDRWFFGIGFFTAGLLTLIGITNIGQSILMLFISNRDPTREEKQKIEPLLNEVIANCNVKIGTKYNQNALRIKIDESREPNAHSMGRNTIILTDGLVRTSSDDELKGVLAYVLGNIHHKYSVMLTAVIFGSLATKICIWLYTVYKLISFAFSKFVPKAGPGAIISLLMLIPLIMFLPVIIINWIGSRILNLSLLFIGRKYIYKADKFAANLGYREELISFLKKFQANNEYDNSIIGTMLAVQPAPMKRISKLENN